MWNRVKLHSFRAFQQHLTDKDLPHNRATTSVFQFLVIVHIVFECTSVLPTAFEKKTCQYRVQDSKIRPRFNEAGMILKRFKIEAFPSNDAGTKII